MPAEKISTLKTISHTGRRQMNTIECVDTENLM